MILDQKIANLIFQMEYEIGRECYNPESYNRYTCEYGQDYRYPVHFESPDGRWKTNGCISEEDTTPEYVPTMKYKFGSNHLFIGQGLINVLEMLEERYDIDFNELEDDRY